MNMAADHIVPLSPQFHAHSFHANYLLWTVTRPLLTLKIPFSDVEAYFKISLFGHIFIERHLVNVKGIVKYRLHFRFYYISCRNVYDSLHCILLTLNLMSSSWVSLVFYKVNDARTTACNRFSMTIQTLLGSSLLTIAFDVNIHCFIRGMFRTEVWYPWAFKNPLWKSPAGSSPGILLDSLLNHIYRYMD